MKGDNITPAEWADVQRSWTAGEQVPAWVHLVDVPPDTDDDQGSPADVRDTERLAWAFVVVCVAVLVAIIVWRLP